jgi:CPA1 family monovalent cation:H+ antiporter
MEAESLFNDAAAAILFLLVLPLATGVGAHSPGETAMQLLFVIFGGAAIGAATGVAALLIAGQSKDHVVETGVTVLAAYGSFFLADQADASGILAAVVAGLLVGNLGVLGQSAVMSQRARLFVVEFWDFAAFLANSTVFLLIGGAIGAAGLSLQLAPALAIAVGLVLFSRAATIYPLSWLFSRSRQAVPAAQQHVLWWGGLRGALALALALSLPESFAEKRTIIVTTFAVVAFSILVQGLTMPVLLKRLGIAARAP